MRARTKKQFADINITPLTDIFLVLLIIMMVVSPLLEYKGLNIAVSTDSNPSTKDDPKAIRLSISALGEVQVDGAAVSWDSLEAELREQRETKPDGILIQIAGDSLHESVARALGVVQAAGIQRVQLQEEQETVAETAP
jgi:biopolymer transport protein ExbD